jgi:hypothetical protein
MILMASGCTFQAGIAYHNGSGENGIVSAGQPLGVVRAVAKPSKHFDVYIEHLSDLMHEDSPRGGFNHAGVLFNF